MIGAACTAAFRAAEAQAPFVPRIFPLEKPGPSTEHPSMRPDSQPLVVLQGRGDEPGIARMEADASHGVEVKAEIDRAEFRQLQPIRVIAEAKNVSGRHRRLPPFWNNRYLLTRVRVFDRRGKLVPKTRFYESEGRLPDPFGTMQDAANVSFQPGASFRLDLIPNLIYDMTRPGDYWVLVETPMFKSLDGPDSDEIVYARAKPLKVKVVAEPGELSWSWFSASGPERP